MKKLLEGYLIKRKDGVYSRSSTHIYKTFAGAKVELESRQELYRKYDWGDEWEDAVIVKAYVCTDDEGGRMKYSVEEIIEGLRICMNGCSDKCPLKGKLWCTSVLKETAAEMLESYTNKTSYKTIRIYADGRIEEVSE